MASEAGAPAATLRAALDELHPRGLTPTRVSSLYATPCFPAGAGPDYVNACAALTGSLPAGEVLTILHEIEETFGRQRLQRWGSRTLDLDLLAIGSQVLPDAAVHTAWRDLPAEEQPGATPDQLILPHPRLQDRAFVLVPLCDVAPDWRHPTLGQTARELCAALPENARQDVTPL